MQSYKIHPRTIKDESGLKFLFNHDDTHFTMRFSGKPMFLLEEWYYHLGGENPDFPALYENVKKGKLIQHKDLLIIKEAMAKTTEFFQVADRIRRRGVSLFSIYAQPYNPQKIL